MAFAAVTFDGGSSRRRYVEGPAGGGGRGLAGVVACREGDGEDADRSARMVEFWGDTRLLAGCEEVDMDAVAGDPMEEAVEVVVDLEGCMIL
jgi:hypothetical protein